MLVRPDMISRHFLFARALTRLTRVFNADIHSEVIKSRRVKLRVGSQSYETHRLSCVSVQHATVCAEDHSDIMEEINNNSVSTQQEQSTTQQKSTTKGETCTLLSMCSGLDLKR